MSDTPRTDAEIEDAATNGITGEACSANFARDLERELCEAMKRVGQWKAEYHELYKSHCIKITAGDVLRALPLGMSSLDVSFDIDLFASRLAYVLQKTASVSPA